MKMHCCKLLQSNILPLAITAVCKFVAPVPGGVNPQIGGWLGPQRGWQANQQGNQQVPKKALQQVVPKKRAQ